MNKCFPVENYVLKRKKKRRTSRIGDIQGIVSSHSWDLEWALVKVGRSGRVTRNGRERTYGKDLVSDANAFVLWKLPRH